MTVWAIKLLFSIFTVGFRRETGLWLHRHIMGHHGRITVTSYFEFENQIFYSQGFSREQLSRFHNRIIWCHGDGLWFLNPFINMNFQFSHPEMKSWWSLVSPFVILVAIFFWHNFINIPIHDIHWYILSHTKYTKIIFDDLYQNPKKCFIYEIR